MNKSKRAILTGAVDIIEQIQKDEDQDLRDQPDSIEYSEACKPFRDNVINLESAVIMIRRVVDRGFVG